MRMQVTVEFNGQRSRLKKVHSYGLKIVHGSPVPQITIFREMECFVRTYQMFNVCVYDPYHTTWLSEIMNLPGKKLTVILLRGYPGKQ